MVYRNIIRIALLFLGLFFAKSSLAYSFITSTPANCGTDAYSQTCVGGLKICGINPGNNVVNCADPATLNPPATSNPVESGTSNATGGYMVDCYAYDSAAPYCNNNGQFVCYQKDACSNAGRTTVCSFSDWTTKSADCGSCKSTYYDCDASATYDCRYKAAIANCTAYDYCSGASTVCTACAAGYTLISNGCYTSIKLAADSVLSDRLRNSTSANPFLTIISAGFVGINTTTPATFLHVAGGSGQTMNMGGGKIGGLDLMPLNSDEAVPLGYLQANYAPVSSAFWAGSSTGHIYNTNTGNVGIGTTNPQWKLQTTGNLGAFNNDSTDHYVLAGVNDLVGNWRYAGIKYERASNVAKFGSYLNAGLGEVGYIAINNSGNVGIGTTNPVSKLDVVGSIYQRAASYPGLNNYFRTNAGNSASSATLNSGVLLFDSGSSVYGMDLGYNGAWRTRIFSAIDIAFAIPNTSPTAQSHFSELMVIKNSGNVGIGVTNPNGKLSVDGSVGIGLVASTSPADNMLDIASDKGSGSGGAIRARYINGGGLLNTEFGALTFKNGQWVAAYAMKGSASAALYTDGEVNMMNGNVGIGTTSPTAKLYLNGGSGIVQNVGGGRISGLDLTPLASTDAVPLGYLQANYSASSSSLWSGTKNGNIWNGDSGAGNVGIGTTAPSQKLDVVGSIEFGTTNVADTWRPILGASSGVYPQPFLGLSNADVNMSRLNIAIKTDIIPDATNTVSGFSGPQINLWNTGVTKFLAINSSGLQVSDNTNLLLNPNGGNVGIGITTPNKKLHVLGGLAVDSGTNTGIASLYLSHTGVNNQHKAAIFTTYTTGFGRSSSMQFAMNNVMDSSIVTTADAKMTILEGGNVGIGTTAPAQNLEVNSDGATIRISSPYAGYSPGIEFADAGVVRSKIGWNNDYNLQLGTIGNNSLIFNTFATERMKINGAGNVSIGTTTSSAKLQISGGTGLVVDASGGLIGGLDLVPLTDDQAVPLGYLKSNYLDKDTSGVAKFVGLTTVLVAGNNSAAAGTGYLEADNICAAQYSGSHVCKTYELMHSISEGLGSSIPTSTTFWITNGPPGYTVNANDCVGRTSVSHADYGSVWVKLATGQGFGSLEYCDTNRKLACCK